VRAPASLIGAAWAAYGDDRGKAILRQAPPKGWRRGDEVTETGDFTALWAAGARVGAKLVARGETVAVAESSAGGLVNAALLAVPGASAYFRGGAAVYTLDAKVRLLDSDASHLTEPRAATEAHALRLGEAVRDRLGATWGVGETGATGPTGNRYGDPPGHTCVGAAGPNGVNAASTVSTGKSERLPNMVAFAIAALETLERALDGTHG
jgi:nicotinamide-nucleotide amidase